MYIAIVCKPGCDIINVKVDLEVKTVILTWPECSDKKKV